MSQDPRRIEVSDDATGLPARFICLETLQEKMEAVEGMADLVRHFQKMRAERAFRPVVPSEKRIS